MDNNTFLHLKRFFNELIYREAQICCDHNIVDLFVSPVKTHVLDSNARPVVWDLVPRAVDDSLYFIDWDKFEILDEK